MSGLVRRLLVVVFMLPAIFLEWGQWIATGQSGDYAIRLMRWGCKP